MFEKILRDSEGNIKKVLITIYFIGIIPLIINAVHKGIYWAHKMGENEPIKKGYSYVKNIVPNVGYGIFVGIVTFILLFIIWTVICILISLLLNSDSRINIKKFFILGQSKVSDIINKLFILGIILLVVISFNLAQYFYIVLRTILPLTIKLHIIPSLTMIITFIFSFILIFFLWKIVCEILIIILRSFEVYYQNNKR
ncbi:MAG: hypothetical protein FH753_17225 [Firmicutes bacterium]|nr:hypothetical protein [Bacillota bacterium]